MILYEFEGKNFLVKYGINVPKSQLINSGNQKIDLQPPFYVKAQVLSGKRKNAGGIILVKTIDEAHSAIGRLFEKAVNQEKVESVLLEEKITFSKEYYFSISYDTDIRSAVITFSEEGGTGIERRKSKVFPLEKPSLPHEMLKVLPSLKKLFLEEDLLLLEINPLVMDTKGQVIALDAKIKLDDEASGRHPERKFPPRGVAGHKVTKREIEAKKIDEGDYRGTAGATFFDLDGDIAILASGGGASLTAMDGLLKAGGRPANYTEYGGNPPKEKVEKLTRVVLSKPNLHGLWIVGAVANFTDVYETLSGFLEALRKVAPKPKFPIVIRRGGPRAAEAFEMLKKVKDFDFHVFGPEVSITESARIVTDLAKNYAASS